MVYHGPADVRYETKPDPRIEHRNDVILRVTRAAICGSDLVVPNNISCGTCYYCQRDLFGLCENTNPNSEIASGVFGYSHNARVLISHRVPLTDVAHAYEMFATKTDECREVVLYRSAA